MGATSGELRRRICFGRGLLIERAIGPCPVTGLADHPAESLLQGGLAPRSRYVREERSQR